VALHAGIIAATLFSFSHSLDITDQSPPVVPVDLVTIGAKTNIAPMVKVQPKEPPKEEAQPPVPDQVQQAPATPQKEEAAPPPPEAASSQPIPQKPAPVVPKTKPQPDQKKDKFDLDAVSALLDKRAPMAASSPNAKVGNRTIKGIGQQNAMTADLEAALYNQITQCWTPLAGAPDASQLIVTFRLFLNPDGSIAQPPQLSGSSASSGGNPYARAAAEAARRAIYTCAPYRLPVDRYNEWRDISFTFDPRKSMGQ